MATPVIHRPSLTNPLPRDGSEGTIRRSLQIAAATAVLICGALLASVQERAFRTGPRFRLRLDEPVTARWENVKLRTVLERVQDDRHVAMLLDRRIDPSQTPVIEFANVSLKEGLPAAAGEFHAGVSVTDNVIYLGPPAASRRLRTLIALRTAELSQDDFQIPKDRQQQWLKLRSISWEDLDSPQDILSRLETEIGFQIQNSQRIEHDLWAAATLPEVTGVAALSLVLIQFDLTFAWKASGEQVELVSIPDTVVIERTHTVRGKPASKMLAEWQAAWPDVEFREVEGAIAALASVEEHEAMAGEPAKRQVNGGKVQPLNQRSFDGQIKDISAKELMAELEKSGIVFAYDADELAAAGVDLDRFVKINARKLSAKEFFRLVFEPLGIRCEIDGVTVTLHVKGG